jgi:CBS domain-containing protein
MLHTLSDTEHTEPLAARVRDLMTPAPLAISPETSVQEAYRLMQNHRLGHLPVCEDGRLVGLLSACDLRLVCPRPPPASRPTRCTHCWSSSRWPRS